MSAQMEMMSIAGKLKPGHQVLIPVEMVRDAVVAEREPSIFNLFDTRVDRYEVEEFLAKVSRNWEFKYKWENNFDTGEEFLVMYQDPMPAHYEFVIKETLAPTNMEVGAVCHEGFAEYAWVDAPPILRAKYYYCSKRSAHRNVQAQLKGRKI